MNAPTITAETNLVDFIDQDPVVPTLPLKIISDQQEFEKIVLALRMEYEIQKPVGNFF